MRAVLFAILVVAASCGAEAATIGDLQGRVLVDRGDGFRPINGPIGAEPGMRVMAAANGSATIIYENGCRERVEPGAVITVRAEGTCQGGGVSPYLAGAVLVGGGAALAVGLSNRNDNPASP